MKQVDKILSVIEKILNVFVVVLFVGMLFSLSVQVISRYVFNTGFSWTEESARYMMVWLVFTGAALCTKRDIHVAVDAVEEMVPKISMALKLIQRIIIIVYCGLVFNFGLASLANAAKQTSPNMQVPMNVIYGIFPVAMTFILIYAIRNLAGMFLKKEGGTLS